MHQLEFLPVTPGFLHAGIGSTGFFLTEVLFFREPHVSPIMGAHDIDQVSTAKSSIHFKYFYLLKITAEYFPFVTKEKPERNL